LLVQALLVLERCGLSRIGDSLRGYFHSFLHLDYALYWHFNYPVDVNYVDLSRRGLLSFHVHLYRHLHEPIHSNFDDSFHWSLHDYLDDPFNDALNRHLYDAVNIARYLHLDDLLYLHDLQHRNLHDSLYRHLHDSFDFDSFGLLVVSLSRSMMFLIDLLLRQSVDIFDVRHLDDLFHNHFHRYLNENDLPLRRNLRETLWVVLLMCGSLRWHLDDAFHNSLYWHFDDSFYWYFNFDYLLDDAVHVHDLFVGCCH